MKLNVWYVYIYYNKICVILFSYYDLVNIVFLYINIIMVKWFYYNEYIKGLMLFYKMVFLFFKIEMILIYMINNIIECMWIL